MGFRFRKSIRIGGARINISKTGIGCSFGIPGFRVTKLANGRTRTTASIPGTGISYVKETCGAKRKAKMKAQQYTGEEFSLQSKQKENKSSGIAYLAQYEKQMTKKTNKTAPKIASRDTINAVIVKAGKKIFDLFRWLFGMVIMIAALSEFNIFGILCGLITIPVNYKFLSGKWRIILGVLTFFGFCLTLS